MTVAETRCALGVDGDWPGAVRQGLGGRLQCLLAVDERRQALARLQQRNDSPRAGLDTARSGPGVGGGRAGVGRASVGGGRLGHDRRLRRGGRRAATPGASGGRPAAAQMTSHQAVR
jgi:hypothetical protein